MDFIAMLICYVDAGKIVSTLMRDAQILIGNDRLRVVSIKLLGWMKSQHRLAQFRPLHLEKEHAWCNDLRQLMDDGRIFVDVLEIRDGSLDFAATLPSESRTELCAAADRGYRPPLRT